MSEPEEDGVLERGGVLKRCSEEDAVRIGERVELRMVKLAEREEAREWLRSPNVGP